MLEIYLYLYYKFHNVFKAFSVSQKQIDDYTSNIFVFSFIICLDFIAILLIAAKIFTINISISLSWFFVVLGFIILVINTIMIYKHKDEFDSIVDTKKYYNIWLSFVIITIILQFWPLIYILG